MLFALFVLHQTVLEEDLCFLLYSFVLQQETALDLMFFPLVMQLKVITTKSVVTNLETERY